MFQEETVVGTPKNFATPFWHPANLWLTGWPSANASTASSQSMSVAMPFRVTFANRFCMTRVNIFPANVMSGAAR